MTKAQESQIRKAFAPTPVFTEELRDICDALAYAHRMLALEVGKVCAQSRECSKALGHLEESLDWAIKAVVRYHDKPRSTKADSGDED